MRARSARGRLQPTRLAQNVAAPVAVLCGAVDTADVTTVFITHAHFDHMGGLDLFPNAMFYIQKREIDK